MVDGTGTPTRWVVLGAVLGGVLVASLVGLVVLLGGDDGGTRAVEDPTTSTTATTAPPRPSTTTAVDEPDDVVVGESLLAVGGRDRRYLTIEPRAAAPPGGRPVVVVLHGLGVSANAMSRAADWRGAVARDDFLAVFPQGVQDSWNLGPCCGPANVRGIDDLGFLDLLLDELLARPDVDGSRVYLTGFSNGALMVYELACRRPSTFAAVAPMAGANLTGCAPDRPLSLLHQHGDVDLVVPYRGGVAIGSVLTLEAFPSVPDGVAAWAAADGCDPQPVVEAGPDVERTRWVGCAEGVRVELIRIPGVGHVWPRRGAFDPLDVLLAFFDLG